MELLFQESGNFRFIQQTQASWFVCKLQRKPINANIYKTADYQSQYSPKSYFKIFHSCSSTGCFSWVFRFFKTADVYVNNWQILADLSLWFQLICKLWQFLQHVDFFVLYYWNLYLYEICGCFHESPVMNPPFWYIFLLVYLCQQWIKTLIFIIGICYSKRKTQTIKVKKTEIRRSW